MSAGTFSVGQDKSEKLSPKHYGYWLIRWAADASDSILDGLARFQFGKNPTMEAFRMKPYYVTLQLIALNSAAYRVYATDFLRVGPLVTQEIQLGIKDGIADLRNPAGLKLSPIEEEYFSDSLSAYVGAIMQEFDKCAGLPQDVFRPHAGIVSETFFALSSSAYPEVRHASAVDKLLLGLSIAGVPLAVFNALAQKTFLQFDE